MILVYMPVAMSYHSNRQDFLDELVGFSVRKDGGICRIAHLLHS